MSSSIRGAPDTRSALLEAAVALLRDGEEVSMKAVADRAGISRQGAYIHFDARDDLLLAAVELANESIGLPAELERIACADTAIEALDRFVAAHVRQARELGAAMRAIDLVLERDRALARRWRARPQGRETVLRQIIVRLAAEGRLKSGIDAAEARDILMALTTLGPVQRLEQAGWSRARTTTWLQGLARGALLE